MLSLEHNTSEETSGDQEVRVYDKVLDSGLKIVDQEKDSNTHLYTVEVSYRLENCDLHSEEVTFLESKTEESQALVRGEENTLNEIVERLNGDFELEENQGNQYITY